jgi:cytidylate kinase
MKGFVVAIDGPAGSGKSTIAKILAKKYCFTYLDTGAMYRMVAFYAMKHNLDWQQTPPLKRLITETELDIQQDRFYLNGEDVTEKIRTPAVSEIASSVSTIQEIRKKLVEQQRKISNDQKIILDGRDIGTVVFPDADLKIFLIASPEERANRRYREYQEKGIQQSYETVLSDIRKRDHLDSTRLLSPLRKAVDAIEIDSSRMTIHEVVDSISSLIDFKLHHRSYI